MSNLNAREHANDTRTRHARARGMTLVEVTTSTATVTVLLALLLPALGQSRREAKQVHCLANLGRLAEATTIYATTDSHEMAVPVHPLMGLGIGVTGEFAWGGKSGIGESQAGSDPLASKWGTQEGRGPASRPLNKIIYGEAFSEFRDDPGPNTVNWLADSKLDLDTFHCPADYGYSGHNYAAWRQSGLTSYDHYGNSYAASTAWIGLPGGACTILSHTSFLKPVSRVPNPANTLMLVENAGLFAYRKNYGLDGCSSLTNGLGNDVGREVRGWHGRAWRFQVAFSDGHAGTVHIEGHQQPKPRIGRYPWNTTYNFWHCVIFRGAGWQIDTLPAPPVRTNIPCVSGAIVSTIG